MRPLLLALASLALGAVLSAQQTPTFQTRVDVIPIDVGIFDSRGVPIQDLAASDFTVRIDGQPRRVISTEWVPLAANRAEAPSARVPAGYASNEQTIGGGGRLIVLAIDQPSIPFTAIRALQDAVNAFVDRLTPDDRIAVVGFGEGAPSVGFTTDRDRVKQAVARMPGQQRGVSSRHGLGLSTALSIDRDAGIDRDRCAPRCANQALDVVVSRNCPPYDPLNPSERDICKLEIASEARSIALSVRQEGDATIRAMRMLLNGVKGIEAPKTLILLSQRFYMDQEREGIARVNELGALASAARTSIYAVRLQDDGTDISRAIQSDAPAADRILEQQGIDTLVGAARGAMFNVSGTGTGVFDRIASELSGYYLLGVEPAASDRDGKPHPIAVDVSRRGVTVRTRRAILSVRAVEAGPATSPREAATAALASPLPFSGLPMRGIVFALRGPDPSKLQLLVHSDIGSGYTAPTRVTVAYVVLDRDGRPVEGQVSDSRLTPAANGLPSPVQFVGGGSVAPGDYTVKLAAVDGDRTGTLEIPLRAALVDAGAVKLTDLMAGGPVPPGDLLRPTIGARVSFGAVHGYFEAYGADAAALAVTFEVAGSDQGPALLSARVAGRQAGDDRAIFSHMLVVQSLPAGEYRLRATVTNGETRLTTLVRAFELGPVAGTGPAAGAPAVVTTPAAPVDLAIAVNARDLTPPFRRDDALKPATVATFRVGMAPAARPAFEKGLGHMQKGEYADAETSFRFAQRQDPGSVAALVYLAACLAAAGHDTEAANAWQTALARGSDAPEIYEWLGESLMRGRVFADARTMFEDAVERFPADSRFARPLALLYATSGKGRDAVKTMERFLADRPDDARSHFLVVQWIFNLHRGGAVVHDKGTDLQLARSSAARYLSTNLPDQPLVRQWMDFLEKEK